VLLCRLEKYASYEITVARHRDVQGCAAAFGEASIDSIVVIPADITSELSYEITATKASIDSYPLTSTRDTTYPIRAVRRDDSQAQVSALATNPESGTIGSYGFTILSTTEPLFVRIYDSTLQRRKARVANNAAGSIVLQENIQVSATGL
jgi:hypothetical protein